MSTDNDDTPERKRLSVKDTPIGENEMFRVRRREVELYLRDASEADLQELDALLHEGGRDNMPFELRLALEWEAIEAELDDLGWPPPRGWYEVERDGWRALPEDEQAKLAVDYDGVVEWLDTAAPCRIETGENYIKRRAVPLSRPWWLGRLGEQIIEILGEPDPDRRLTLTLFYGRDRQRFEDQHGHLPTIRHGGSFHSRPTEQATEANEAKGDENKKVVIRLAKAILSIGKGRFKNKRINISALSKEVVGNTSIKCPVGIERVEGIIGYAVKCGELR